MPPSYFMRCFPWDLEEEGIETVLTRLSGEVGMDGICVPAVSGDVAQLRTTPSACGRVFRARAASNYQPDAKHYATSRLRLPAASWMKSKNSLERIARVCEKQRLSLRVAVGPLAGESLADRFEFAQRVNCFGDRVDSSLCLSNPDVRGFYAATIRDLAENYPLNAIALVGLAGDHDPHGRLALHSFEPDLPLAYWTLLSWCFCASCCGRAADMGIDAQAAMSTVRARILGGLDPNRVPLQFLPAILDEEPLLARYHTFRRQSFRSLLQLVRSSTALRLICEENDFCEELDFTEDFEQCDAVVSHLIRGVIDDCRHQALPASRIEAVQRIHPPEIADGPALVAALRKAAAAGFAAIELHAYGVAPDACLDWVRQGIRYARRETGGAP